MKALKNIGIQESIIHYISRLDLIQQVKLLDFIKSIQVKQSERLPVGLIKFAGVFEKEKLKEIEKAIEDCEQVD